MRCQDCGRWVALWHCYTEEGRFCKEHGDWRPMVDTRWLCILGLVMLTAAVLVELAAQL